ncbi:uncharacterized protein YALI1_B23603g [Yarrowia lipolytica]|uniref:Uncharacterized protein n=1 Tax=Yarrowia lipolytica TaxID=4952 RepID=A0A1D8N8B9_YARLL|nr:hypothetical protein YALI1_B23603g [Yarrowia lipolytica]
MSESTRVPRLGYSIIRFGSCTTATIFVPVSFAAGGYDSQVPPTNRQTDLLGLIPSRRQWVNSKRRKKDTVKTL